MHGKYGKNIRIYFHSSNLNVKLVDPDGQVGVGVKIEVIHSLLDSVEDVREGLVIKHARFQRTNFKINFLFYQQKIIHLEKNRKHTEKSIPSPF